MARHQLSTWPRCPTTVNGRTRSASVLLVTAMLVSGFLISTVGTAIPAGADTSIPVFQPSTQLPSISGATYTSPNDMSCPSVNNCVIVGSFDDGSEHGFIMSESNGTWGSPAVIDYPSSGTPVSLTQVSCPSVGNCTAVGSFQDNSYNTFTFALSERNGQWGTGEQLASSDFVAPSALSCWAPGYCTLIVEDVTLGSIPAVMNQTNYVWDASPAPLSFPTYPSNNYLQSISCPSAGNCTAIGTNNVNFGIAIEERNGSWQEGTNLANPPGYATAQLTSVSCSSPGNCTAVGSVSDHAPDGAPVHGLPILSLQGAGITESNGLWGPYSVISNLTGETVSVLNGVSCTSPGNCTAVGFSGAQPPVAPTLNGAPHYGGVRSSTGISLTESSGTWGGLSAQLPSGLILDGVVCITSALCVTYGAIGSSSVWVSASVPQLTLSATSPANPTLGLAYSAQFSASGGVAPYSFSLSQGSLPPGLSIDPATGTVSGIPTGVGTYRFTVTLTDNSNPSQSVSAPVTMVVGASLAATGADLRSLVVEGSGLLILGLGLVEITRRRVLQIH